MKRRAGEIVREPIPCCETPCLRRAVSWTHRVLAVCAAPGLLAVLWLAPQFQGAWRDLGLFEAEPPIAKGLLAMVTDVAAPASV